MGLAACQARLLTLTMRRTDDQYKLMKLANDQLRLACQSEDIEEEFDLAKNAALYTYQYDANDKASTENLTYSGLMGSVSLHSGRDPIYLTNKDGQVILDSAYGAAMSAANMAGNGTAKDNAKCFNAFAAAMTGDKVTDWFAAVNATVSNSNVDNVDNNNNEDALDAEIRALITSEQRYYYSHNVNDYINAGNDFIAEHGNYKFDTWAGRFDESGKYNGISDDVATEIWHDYDLLRKLGYEDAAIDEILLNGEKAINSWSADNELGKQVRDILNGQKNGSSTDFEHMWVNNKGECKRFYERHMLECCCENDLDGGVFADYIETGSINEENLKTLPEESYMVYHLHGSELGFSDYDMTSKVSGNELLDPHTDSAADEKAYNNAYNTVKGWFEYNQQHPEHGRSVSNTDNSTGNTRSNVIVDNYGKVIEQETINTAKFYYGIFKSALNNGYKVDDQITNNTYLYAKLENGIYQINGKFASDNKQCTKKTVRDDEFEYEKAKDNYNKALNDIKKQEKTIETKKESVQADLQACETEMQSVQSLIDKNIERSFTYCQA
ncbi:hypothetical protein IJ818_07535 [bacterium]|nr:hypothetical protein [bacterium]